MRLFFGLDFTGQQKIQLSEWRDKAFGPLPKAVPAANLHLTLSFLGEVAEAKLEKLTEYAVQLEHPAIKLTLDEMGFFAKPRVAFLGLTEPDAALIDLHRKIKSLVGKSGLVVENRDYIPHVTLFRGNKTPPAAPVIPPAFEFSVADFCLFQSVSSEHGVHYPVIKRWSLTPAFKRC